ncbi:GNAT family N-acetyltransferase [Streptomyces sp. NPDC020917]|uniref:GNAT family N-acetyltransferase n=1 Tax=Streptomyces sp. NPDC020917 TaxID=3365102 RepID=UPI00379B7E8D
MEETGMDEVRAVVTGPDGTVPDTAGPDGGAKAADRGTGAGGDPRANAPTDAWTDDGITVVPANRASWEDLEQVLGTARCHGGLCYCQRFKITNPEWRVTDDGERAHRLRAQSECGQPEAPATSGLVAYAGDEPVGWCAVEPRTAYPKLLTTRIPWAGRDEDRGDAGVWAVTCFVVRAAARRTRITHVLARAAVDHARRRGARAVEGYPMLTAPGQDVPWGELHVGTVNAFAAAGLTEVSRPTKRRVVMRIDFPERPAE